jgi:hypothetical protein
VEPESTDPEVRKKSESEKRNREMLPGLLLFRRGSNDAALAIFLVGETPTRGIDRYQFAAASCYVKHLQEKEPRGLRILGPTFSGSFDSLDAALRDSGENAENIEIRTGTATVQRSWEGFQKKYTRFTSTIHSGSHTYDLLRATFPQTDHVAFLTEDSTAFGHDSDDIPKNYLIYNKNDAVIHYPREISRLRNAYQHDPALTASQKNADITAIRRQLQLPLGDSQIGRDTVPQFSSEHTPITQETELLQIAESLKRGKFHTVAISGTNVLDILFLSRFLREYCPDLRIMVVGSDLLFVHGTDSLDYTGILVASTYPQFNPQDLWIAAPDLPLRSFASDAAKGVYNAGLAFLREKSFPLRDYSLRGDGYGYADQPPVWISVVGAGSFWPIAALKGSDSPRLEKNRTPSSQQSDERFHLALPSRLWISLFLGCTALILLYAVICLFLILSKTPLKRWCSDLHPAPDAPDTSPGRWRYHMATTLLLLIAYCSLALPAVYLASRLNSWRWGYLATLAILPSVALIAIATYTLSRYGYSGGALIKVAAATIACVAVVLVAPSIQPDESRLFFFIRSVSLPSGVAPSLPFLLIMLTLIWYAWRNLQRFIFIQERDPYRPEPVPLASCVSKSIQESLNGSFFIGDARGYVIIAVVWISVLAAISRFGSLERGWYDLSFLILLSVASSCLLGTAYGYLQVWYDLRLFLEDLNLRPIRRAFLVLPSVSTWSPLWQPRARKRSYAIPGRCVESSQMLCRYSPHYYPGMTPAVRELEDKVGSIIQTAAKGERETIAMVKEANQQGNEIAKCLEDQLWVGSWSHGSSETADKLGFEDESKPDKPDTLAAEAVALRYIAFIRYVMLQLQNQLSFLTVGFILTAVALNCYPFQGASYFRWWLTAVFIVLAVVVIKVLAEMSRDATLSRLTDTPVGEVGGEFYFKLLAAGALPLLTVVASHFPGVGRFLFSWVQPAFSALH